MPVRAPILQWDDPMSFAQDNDAYEAWLAQHCDVVKKDIKHKHSG